MESTFYTPTAARKKSYDLQTDYKTFGSPSPYSPKNRRNPNRLGSKLQNLKSSVDDIIVDVAQKQRLQRSAIQRVYDVNAEVSQYLTASSVTLFSPRSENVWPESNMMKASRKTTAFEETSNMRDPSEQHETSQFFFVKDPSSESLENLRLQKELNNELRGTNELIKRVKALRKQQQQLNGRIEHSNEGALLMQENIRLRKELRRVEDQCQYTINDLLGEFYQLKEENEKLRRDTLQLLRAKQNSRAHLERYYA